MADTQDVAKVKGSVLIHLRDTLRRDFGETTLERALSDCAPATQAVMNGDVVADQFYPERVLASLVKSIFKLVGPEAFPAYARRMAKDLVNTSLKFVLRIFVSPRRLSDNNQKLWSTLHDSGRVEVIHGEDDCSHTVIISDFDFITDEYELASVEFHCGILELTGAKNVSGTSSRTGHRSYRQKYHWTT